MTKSRLKIPFLSNLFRAGAVCGLLVVPEWAAANSGTFDDAAAVPVRPQEVQIAQQDSSTEEVDRARQLLGLVLDCQTPATPEHINSEIRTRTQRIENLSDETFLHLRRRQVFVVHRPDTNRMFTRVYLIEEKARFEDLDLRRVYFGPDFAPADDKNNPWNNTLDISCRNDKKCVEGRFSEADCPGTSECNPKIAPGDIVGRMTIFVCSREGYERAKLALGILIDAARSKAKR